MPRDKTANHAKILIAAREEFTEYGFDRASMRRIGDRCGMTAAGLYRHCKDKADLFRELVDPAAGRLYSWLEAHVSRSAEALKNDAVDIWRDSEMDMMREVVFPNMEEYRLLITKAQGTVYENFLHDMVERHQSVMLEFLPKMREQGCSVKDIDPKELHILLSAYTTAMFEPVIRGYTQDEALRCLKTLEAFFLPGWKQLLGC